MSSLLRGDGRDQR